jgi:hypothetical protein
MNCKSAEHCLEFTLIRPFSDIQAIRESLIIVNFIEQFLQNV